MTPIRWKILNGFSLALDLRVQDKEELIKWVNFLPCYY